MSVTQKVLAASIGAAQNVSNGILIGDYCICGLIFPANWTGTPGITWQISVDNGVTWYELNDDTGAAVSEPAATAAGKYYAINPFQVSLTGAVLVKLRSGTVAAPALQTNAVVVQVVTRRIYPGVD